MTADRNLAVPAVIIFQLQQLRFKQQFPLRYLSPPSTQVNITYQTVNSSRKFLVYISVDSHVIALITLCAHDYFQMYRITTNVSGRRPGRRNIRVPVRLVHHG